MKDKSNKKLTNWKSTSLDKSVNTITMVSSDEKEMTTMDAVENFSLSGHKKQLTELAKKDPEFYQFLKDQDADLLQFEESESEADNAVVDINDEETARTGKPEGKDFHRVPKGRIVIDLDFVTTLRNSLFQKGRPNPVVVRQTVEAFKACVARVGAAVESPNYLINDSDVFESIVRLCFTHLNKSLYLLLGPVESIMDDEKMDLNSLPAQQLRQNRFRHWNKHKSLVKSYLHALSQFLIEVQAPDVVVCTVHAIADLLILYIYFAKLMRNITKALIRIWSRRTGKCRFAAFSALWKLIKIHRKSFPTVLKWCYLGYVTNVRDVNTESWPLILFMQKSFAELCMINPEVAYQYSFVYIRQTAIHLRNAMIAKRKDLIQTVYNWQFIQCLYLWAQVIAKAYRYRFSTKKNDADAIEELAYPLCQIATSTMKLFPSLKYFVLRMHCIRILLIVQQNCNLHIPTLAYAVELLTDALLILKKKPVKQKGSLKGVDVKCLLKASKAHLDDTDFRQAALEELFSLHLEAAHLLQQSCAFPDVIIPLIHQIKNFIKNCDNVEFKRLFKSLDTKLKEQAAYAREILDRTDLDLTDKVLLKYLEGRLCAPDAPLTKFCISWQKVRNLKRNVNYPGDTKLAQPVSLQSKTAETTEQKQLPKERIAETKKGNMITTEHKKIVASPENDEDILEDLVLSDMENN